MKRSLQPIQNQHVQDIDINLLTPIKVVVTITVKKVARTIREDDGKSNYIFFY